MKIRIKKNGNNRKRFELHNKENMKTFEKKPQNGGTPAIENKAKMRVFEKKLDDPKSTREYIVLVSE